MALKFRLGLFDDPFVDEGTALAVVGNPTFQAEAEAAQRRAQVVLQNEGGLLPLNVEGAQVWLHGVDPQEATARGFAVAETLGDADVAILRVSTPFERLHPYHFFGARQTEGRLDFREGNEDWEAIQAASDAVPTVVAVDLDRPAVVTDVVDRFEAVVATFGASDSALLDVLTGQAAAEGQLPFELPSSMADVERQDPAAPDDTTAPLFEFGAGLMLEAVAAP